MDHYPDITELLRRVDAGSIPMDPTFVAVARRLVAGTLSYEIVAAALVDGAKLAELDLTLDHLMATLRRRCPTQQALEQEMHEALRLYARGAPPGSTLDEAGLH